MNFTNTINEVKLYSSSYPIILYKRPCEDRASNSTAYDTKVYYRGKTFNFNDMVCLIESNEIDMEEAYLALMTIPYSSHGYSEYDEWDEDDNGVAHIAHNAKESGIEW